MQKIKTGPVDAGGNLAVTPSATSSNHDFDFLHGRWTIHNRKLKERLTGCDEWTEFTADHECVATLNGYGNFETFQATIGGESIAAIGVRLFDPKTRLWTIYWADSRFVVLDTGVTGSFDGAAAEFYGRDTSNGTPVLVKFHWDKTDAKNPVWSQAFSADGGQTWEWNWYMTFTPREDGALR